MSNHRSGRPAIKGAGGPIPELSRSGSIGINGLVDPSDSVVLKKERNVHSPIGEEALRGSPPTPLSLPPTAIGSPSYGRRPSLSSVSNSPPAGVSIWSELSAPLVLPPLAPAPRNQLPLGSRMSPPVQLDGPQRASPPWETRTTNAANKAAFVPSPAIIKPSPPRTWSDAAKSPSAQQPRRSTLSNLGANPPHAPTASVWEQPPAPPQQRRGSISNQDPIARPVPPTPASSILAFMQHHVDASPPVLSSGIIAPAAAPTPAHMHTLLGPGKHDEFHKSLIPRSVPLSQTASASVSVSASASKVPAVPAVLRLPMPAEGDREVSESEGGDSASIASDISPQISPFTSPRVAEDTELAGIFGQMEMDPVDGFGHAQEAHLIDGGVPSGEHPYGEFPSPTLFVRNINSNVEDDELRALFEPYGPIRSMYTQCKHRGFVMISYFEIRHAQSAMMQLQGRLVRRRKLDIHYSIPKSFGSAHSSPSPSSRSPNTFHRSASMQRTPSGPWGASVAANPALQSSSSAPLSYAIHVAAAFSPPPAPQIAPPAARLPVSHSEPLSRPEALPIASQPPRSSSPDSALSSSPKGSSAASAKSGGRHHRPVASEDKSKYDMDLDRIRTGDDTRLTLMIKNIPNKYNQKMLLAAVDEHHKGTYDFFYLPIDFKNKCNVGYAFINFVRPISIVAFYQEFNNRKWEKFNSEKVCTISYARIQGKAALIQHFQNSSLMSEDKKCRPIIFHSEGPNQGEQEPFPVGPNIRTRRTVGNKTSKSAGGRKGKEEKPSPDPAPSPSSL